MESSNTTASIISLIEKLEDKSSEYFRCLAELYPEKSEVFLDFIKENKKNKKQIIRTYQETISDALEACFIQVNLSDCQNELTTKEDMQYPVTLEMAIKLEEKIQKFYLHIIEQSESLLATITNAFRNVAKRRSKRKIKLELLLDTLNGQTKEI